MSDADLRTGTWVTRIGGAPTAMRIRRCRLTAISGPDDGLTKEFEAATIRVGARASCDLTLTDRRVSGYHFEICVDEQGYRLRDLESTNGTFVAGHRVHDIYLNPSSLIAVGETKLSFEPLQASVAVALSASDSFNDLIGRSVTMRALFASLEHLAPTDTTVLVTGETGTGKELVAAALHEQSRRCNGPFVVLDCSAIAENLVESELFGHERGAFTGAVAASAGAFERADGGTLFLDEIGELPMELQPKLLRALEQREIRRVGGKHTIPVNIRVVSATNRDLAVQMNRGEFREDLFYRLAVVRLHVPPLRDRRDDIALLIQHFLQLIPGGDTVQLAPTTIDALQRHAYPGNVRELRNLIERAVVMAAMHSHDPAQLGDKAGYQGAAAAIGHGPPELFQAPVDDHLPFKEAKRQLVDEFERRYLRRLLDRHGGNVSAAARDAGLDRMTVHKMISRLKLANPRPG